LKQSQAKFVGGVQVEGGVSAETIGFHLARLRKRRGFFQREIARRSRISCKALSNIECGITIPRVCTVLKVLAALTASPGAIADVAMVAKRVAMLRRTYLLTQEEMSRLVGAYRDEISAWERGENVPSLAALRRACAVFAVGLDFFSLPAMGMS
jgi:transcriptional regulator with XRE-family HTH domain